MSAIWGKISFKDAVSENVDAQMREHYRVRCKLDRIETVSGGNCYMGCGLQYITAEAEKEVLPFHDAKAGIYLTADCILDNREFLLEELQIADSTVPDGELIYRGYLKWGVECFAKLRGIFAIAIYDTKKEQVILVSDHAAQRCLYYYYSPEGITFSTLLEPIRRVHPEIGANELYLMDYLLAPGLLPNVIGAETPYQNIYNVPSASYLVFSGEGVETKRYWNPAVDGDKYKCKNAEGYIQTFRELMKSVVRANLRTSGEVGISLSSGMDSLTVGTLAASELAKKNQNLYTYTYVPVSDATYEREYFYVYNEKDAVLQVKEMHPNMQCRFLDNDGKDCLSEIPKILKVLEIPFKSFGNSPSLYEIYQKASGEGCKVVLTGQYGNCTISHGYINDVLYDLYERKSFLKFFGYLNNYCKYMKMGRKKAVKNCLDFYARVKKIYQKERNYTTTDSPFVAKALLERYPLKERYDRENMSLIQDAPTPGRLYKKVLCEESEFIYLGEIETKMGLEHGVVLRDPTRDRDVITFCYYLPYELFAFQGEPRWLVREGMKDYIPEAILGDWLRYGLQNSDWLQRIKDNWENLYPHVAEVVRYEGLQGYLNIEEVEEYLRTNQTELTESGRKDMYFLVIYVLGFYLENFLGKV